ncbi:MAG TPA: tetratricopeptide repeat protein [Gemmataceae bacterium]|nr:tetratricopeptide repeat protein [Gemmataceae bacterium]
MMHHLSRFFSPRRLGLLSLPLLAAAAVVFAAEPPADGPEALFRRAAESRLQGAEHFAEAARAFDAAATAFQARRPQKEHDPEWVWCARCAQAEMLLRLHRWKDARDLLTPLLARPGGASYRDLALFYHGTACFRLGDDMAAGRSLDQMAPLSDPSFGGAARFLLAQLHERNDERAEALAQYEGILKEFAEAKKASSPQGPPSAAVQKAAFAAAVLDYEDGRFDKARDLFAELAASAPPGPAADARLYQGCCEVQLKQFKQAVETLSAVKDDDLPRVGQAWLWLGRAQAEAADPDDADARREALETALKTLKNSGRVWQLFADRKSQNHAYYTFYYPLVLRELAAVHERLGDFAEAADLYARVQMECGDDEAALQREATARTLAGDTRASEKLAVLFEKQYPRSVLTPEVQLRRAENAALLALQAPPDEAARLNTEAARRFQLVLDKYPEFEHVPQARLSLAWLDYRGGEYDKERSLLEQIEPGERKADLAAASYLLADILIRTAPTQTDDALAAGRAQEQLNQAANLLTELVGSEPYAGRDPDALMRLGLCQRRLAGLAAKDEDRNALSDASRASFERVLLEYPGNELQPHAVLERARWIKRNGDVTEAIRRLRPFALGALDKHPLAPLATVNLAGWLRTQDGMAPEAVRMLTRCRRQFEKTAAADSAHAEWAAMLRYQDALALQDAGRYEEGRALLKEIMNDQARPESAEARLAWGEGMLAEGRNKIGAADALLQNNPPEDQAAALRKDRADGVRIVNEAADYLEEQARNKNVALSPALQARLFYEAAWVWRSLIDEQVGAARQRIQDERRKQAPDAPDVQLGDVPLQPAEKKARAAYETLIADQPDLLPLAAQARLELAELRLQRGEPAAAAVTLLKQALDQEPASDLSARLGLRLADCLVTAGDEAGAMRQLDRVAGLTDTPLAPVARYRAAAWIAGKGEWTQAVDRLKPFRDEDALKGLGYVSDKALLLLGDAYSELGQDEPSTQAYEQLLATFADSGWRRHARYGEAQTLHRQKKVAEALDAYLRALAAAPPDVAVRSQIQIGICESEMGRFSEAVESLLGAYDPDFPVMNAFALVEAAFSLDKLGRRGEAAELLRQCSETYPKSPWGDLAAARRKKNDDRPPHALPEAGRLLALDVPAREPLDPLGEQQPPEPSVLEDLMDRAGETAILSRPLVMRPIPSPLLRLPLPDPYENRGAVRVRGFTDLDDLPPLAPLKTPE